MKFGFLINNQGIPEWKEMYLNYKILKKLIKPYKVMSKAYMKINYLEPNAENKDHSIITITNANIQFFDELKEFGIKFEEITIKECIKISTFFEVKLLEELKRWKLFKININIIQNIQNDKDYDQKKIQLLNAFHFFYKELNLLYEYISVNQEGLRKIIKKFKKKSKALDLRYKSIKKQIRDLIQKNCLKNAIQKLIFLKAEVESCYIDTFYKKYGRKDGQNTLRKISQGKLMTHQETFLFGFFLGFSCLMLMIIFFLSWLLELNIEDLKAFPLFEGIGLIIVYYWTLAINVYFWMKYNINYKLIFKFNFHFSEISEIFKRAAYFTMIFLVMLVWFLILHFQSRKLGDLLIIFPKNICPLVVWFAFFGYCFFPSTQIFNFLGRIYVLKLIRKTFCSLLSKKPVSFREIWALEQLMSFSSIARDFAYLIMFYFHTDIAIYFNLGYYLIFFVIFFKISQNLRLIMASFSLKSLDNLELLKNLVIFCFVYLDFINTNKILMILFGFLISSLISLWDTIIDWNLIKTSSSNFLRKELSFDSKYVYYFLIIVNFLLRICWCLSLVPHTLLYICSDPHFIISIEIFEMLRRAVWNFLTIEKQHICNCGIFKAVEEIKLPYSNIEFEFDELMDFYQEDLKLPDSKKHYEKFDTSLKSPLMVQSQNSQITNVNLMEEIFTCSCCVEGTSSEEIFKSKMLAQNINVNKKYYESIKAETREFVERVKLNMEFQFKVVREKTEEEEIRRIVLPRMKPGTESFKKIKNEINN